MDGGILLGNLQELGLVLTSEPGGGLLVQPKALLTEELRRLIRDNKAALVAAIERRTKGWTDLQISRFTARSDLFARKGVPAGEAEHLAERLLHRDGDFDDRTSCGECRRWNGRFCKSGRPVLLDVFQRCEVFVPEELGL